MKFSLLFCACFFNRNSNLCLRQNFHDEMLENLSPICILIKTISSNTEFQSN
ncbi:unnamed protein product [Brugia timori]|uniref:Uncharacterized protein n=1 Tax=Brugia timori TaxID=42155 RepID=A0A0R3QN33_9BILA|nr:unnamed protein product [Brugia timori]